MVLVIVQASVAGLGSSSRLQIYAKILCERPSGMQFRRSSQHAFGWVANLVWTPFWHSPCFASLPPWFLKFIFWSQAWVPAEMKVGRLQSWKMSSYVTMQMQCTKWLSHLLLLTGHACKPVIPRQQKLFPSNFTESYFQQLDATELWYAVGTQVHLREGCTAKPNRTCIILRVWYQVTIKLYGCILQLYWRAIRSAIYEFCSGRYVNYSSTCICQV